MRSLGFLIRRLRTVWRKCRRRALAVQAFQDQIRLAGSGPYLFPRDNVPTGHLKTLKTVWHATLRQAKVPYFRRYDLPSTYATRPSAGGVADERVTQMLRQGDAKVFKKYSQMKLQMKREALEKINRQAPAGQRGEGFCYGAGTMNWVCLRFCYVLRLETTSGMDGRSRSVLESRELYMSGRSAAW
jgi:hypothetical protein